MNRRIHFILCPSDLGARYRGGGLGVLALFKIDQDIANRELGESESTENKLFESKKFQVLTAPNTSYFEDRNTASHAELIQENYPYYQQVSAAVEESLDAEAFPIILTGDHSIAIGGIAGLAAHKPNERIGVIWIDAHADLHAPYTSPSGNMHGMSLAAAAAYDHPESRHRNKLSTEEEILWEKVKGLGADHPNISLRDLVYLGLRSTETEEDQAISEQGALSINVDEINRYGTEACTSKALDHLKDCDHIYLSFDVDSMDSLFCIGTGTPVRDGLSFPQAKELVLELIQSEKVAMMELTEINPLLDRNNTVAQLSYDILQGVKQKIS
jgi:arginase